MPAQVNMEVVDDMHTRYFDAVEALMLKHMPTFPGYDKLKLVMIR